MSHCTNDVVAIVYCYHQFLLFAHLTIFIFVPGETRKILSKEILTSQNTVLKYYPIKQ